jgi:hypothetical protein
LGNNAAIRLKVSREPLAKAGQLVPVYSKEDIEYSLAAILPKVMEDVVRP